MLQSVFHQVEIIIRIQDVEYRDSLLVGDGIATERHQLVEDRQRVTHTAICFLCHHVQCLFARRDTFIHCHLLQVRNDIRYGDTIEVIYLTTT